MCLPILDQNKGILQLKNTYDRNAYLWNQTVITRQTETSFHTNATSDLKLPKLEDLWDISGTGALWGGAHIRHLLPFHVQKKK